MSTCVGCEQRIVDQYLLRVEPDMEWHVTCLKCNECGLNLDEFCTCFIRDGKAYCKQDYIRLFTSRCSRCDRNFKKNDLVMKIHRLIYHLDCFSCDTCGRQLMSGDRYVIKDERRIVCEVDFELSAVAAIDGTAELILRLEDDQDEEAADISNTSTQSSDIVNLSSFEDNFNKNSTEAGLEFMDISSSSAGLAEACNASSSSSGGGGGGGGGAGGGRPKSPRSLGTSTKPPKLSDSQKTTRVRTVLNEKQLHMLRTCYGANPRPDALMKEQLVEMTGLSSRVIRVWFQNKRCKDKKRVMLMKQIHQHHQETAAVSMVAASPVRHDPPISIMPVTVQQYQVPWPAIIGDHQARGDNGPSSFALLSPPPPQSAAHSILKSSPSATPSTAAASAAAAAAAAAAVVVAAAECHSLRAPFQKLLRSFGDLSDEDDSVVSVDEPYRGLISQAYSERLCGSLVKNSMSSCNPSLWTSVRRNH